MDIEIFIESWQLFVKNLNEVATEQLRRREGSAGYDELEGLLDSVVKDILGDQGLSEMRQALDLEITEDEAAVTYMHRELKFFNAAHLSRDPDEEADDGDTIKTSMEEIFKIGDWLKKRLKFLNEILKILRGGA